MATQLKPVPTMDGDTKIDDALAKVTSGVKRLAKGERNSHGGYNFAGIDDFLEMTGKLCGDAGLAVIMDEEGFEVIPEFFATKNGKVAALQMRFGIWLRCGGEKDGPYRRSIMVPANMGSQAFGAAQSYVLKQFLRATFQIPTGDKGEDIDAHDTGSMTGEHPPRTRTTLDGPHTSPTALKAALHGVSGAVRKADSDDAITAILAEHKSTINQARRDLPLLIDGDPEIPEDVGFKGLVEACRAKFASAAFAALIESMTACTTQAELAEWTREHGDTLEGLPDAEGRTFEAAYDAHASTLPAKRTQTPLDGG